MQGHRSQAAIDYLGRKIRKMIQLNYLSGQDWLEFEDRFRDGFHFLLYKSLQGEFDTLKARKRSVLASPWELERLQTLEEIFGKDGPQ